jgi:uncharacterized protein (DUF1800 family)
MALGPDPHNALVALHRFGMGARGLNSGDVVSAAADPRGFVKAELSRPDVALLEAPGLQNTEQLLQAFFADQQRLATQRRLEAQKAEVQKVAAQEGSGAAAAPPAPPLPVVPPQPPIEQQVFRAEALARFQRAAQADVGLAERLVAFWSNHFAISAAKSGFARMICGSYEREAIRPHIFGCFADLMRAAEQHPAMLHYLDNQLSLGPDSRAGRNNPKRGLNENLAREIMELHTLGVDGGYTQTDVTTFAKILTGWTNAGPQGQVGAPGTFIFVPQWHEPGPQVLLGKTYPDTGLNQGEAALDDIVHRPATAKFIATKLVRHFVADDPPPSLVDRLSKVFNDSDGDLRKVTLALIDADEAWTAPLAKMRNPYDYLIATVRLLGPVPQDPGPLLGGLNLLGQPLWTPAQPNGFADTASAWASPEGMKLRLDMAVQIAQRIRDIPNPDDTLRIAFGDAVSPETRVTVARAASKQQGLALLLMSPEMQRR